ncbi:MAG TPA: protein kinase, partial [Mycobacteriales bacterium]|nr:protein kinase [Mycobacteriales bacterium]
MSWNAPGYVADELVGFGATGEVWRGRDTATGELVALKRLRAADPQSSARLRREAAVLAGLDHPHLLRLRETVRSGEEWVLVLDYAAGGSLAALLRGRGRLRPGEVVTALAPLAAALAYAHGQGLVHGDVTPPNILL